MTHKIEKSYWVESFLIHWLSNCGCFAPIQFWFLLGGGHYMRWLVLWMTWIPTWANGSQPQGNSHFNRGSYLLTRSWNLNFWFPVTHYSFLSFLFKVCMNCKTIKVRWSCYYYYYYSFHFYFAVKHQGTLVKIWRNTVRIHKWASNKLLLYEIWIKEKWKRKYPTIYSNKSNPKKVKVPFTHSPSIRNC